MNAVDRAFAKHLSTWIVCPYQPQGDQILASLANVAILVHYRQRCFLRFQLRGGHCAAENARVLEPPKNCTKGVVPWLSDGHAPLGQLGRPEVYIHLELRVVLTQAKVWELLLGKYSVHASLHSEVEVFSLVVLDLEAYIQYAT